ncbi:hypothetical protein M430DRAFT_20445 [Amorphotheca resinae ATCC 22711]|uniref:Uncharacterized protein n=1 Tax=Amorphotheca resinae ATCC 22711 TaxID=857342 RepID=A0A2T3AYJ8_AMORE|nr:hypothetical protein M430DRAFT_20445 [Amorphotheca resinae ATCC 22711]PSS15138.1 hypothetical protein M430DRAFT_20445 [Amorphotheca resinae ATCC 22711]
MRGMRSIGGGGGGGSGSAGGGRGGGGGEKKAEVKSRVQVQVQVKRCVVYGIISARYAQKPQTFSGEFTGGRAFAQTGPIGKEGIPASLLPPYRLIRLIRLIRSIRFSWQAPVIAGPVGYFSLAGPISTPPRPSHKPHNHRTLVSRNRPAQ